MRKRDFMEDMDSNLSNTRRSSFFNSFKKLKPSLSREIGFSPRVEQPSATHLITPQSLSSRLSNVLNGKLSRNLSLYPLNYSPPDTNQSEIGVQSYNSSMSSYNHVSSFTRSLDFGRKFSDSSHRTTNFTTDSSNIDSRFSKTKSGSTNGKLTNGNTTGSLINSADLEQPHYSMESHGFTIIGSKSVGVRPKYLELSGPHLMRLKMSLLETYKRQLAKNTQLLNEKIDEEELEAKLNLERQRADPPLSPDELQIVNTHFQIAQKQPQQLFVEAFRVNLRFSDLATLMPRRWLNDNVIDMYMSLVTSKEPKSFAFTTHFFTRLEEDGYSAVKRWALRKKVNVFEKDVVIVPINQRNSHWTLAVVNNRKSRLEFYDSMPTGKGERELGILMDYLMNEANRMGVKIPKYQLVPYADGPCQSNGYDCGVFVCETSRRMVQNLQLCYTQSQIPNVRNRMALNLIELNRSSKL